MEFFKKIKSQFFASLASVLLSSAFLCTASSTLAAADELKFFTIGTGGTAYTYYPIGGLIANAISKPPGSRECDEGGSCGVDNLIASAVSSRGSLDNLNAIVAKLRNSGFSQSDVAYWIYTGTGTMEGKPPATELRTIASLFDEHIHLVTLADSDINTVADLSDKRVSLDEPASGTYVDAKLVLEAYGLSESDMDVQALKGYAATEALKNGKIDAFFVVAGYPAASVVDLAAEVPIKLVAIDGAGADSLREEHAFFSKSDVPASAYNGLTENVSTIAVAAQWFTSVNEDEELIYSITKALWNDASRQLLHDGHQKGKFVTLEAATKGIGVPLHPGSERFYKEMGVLK